MVDLGRPNTVGLGQVGQILTLTPRADKQDGLYGAQGQMQAARASVNADLVAGQTGETISAGGYQQAAWGMEMMKPLQQLAQAREVLQSQDIAVQAALDMRAQVAALRSSGTDHMEWVGAATTGMDQIGREALGKAARLSPAAAEYVQREINQERLRLTGEVQGTVFKIEADKQIATLDKLDTYTRQTFFQAPDAETRSGLSAKLTNSYRAAAATGLITYEKAEQKIKDYNTYIATNAPTYLADAQGLPAALEFIQHSEWLDPEQKRTAESNVISYLHNRLTMDDAAEKKREKGLKLEQDYRGQKMLQTVLDPKTTIEQLQQISTASTEMVNPARRELRDEQSQAIRKAAQEQIDIRTKRVDPKDDPQAAADWKGLIVLDGHNMDLSKTVMQILNDPRIPLSKGELISQLNATHDKHHYHNSHAFQSLVGQLNAIEPPNQLVDLNKATGSTLGTEIKAAAIALDRLIGQSAGPNGYLSDDEIYRIGQPLVSTAIKQLKEKKTFTAGPSFDELSR